MITLGIVGCGDVAFRSYFPGLAPLEHQARVIACFDPQADRVAEAVALFPGARACGSLDELLAAPGLTAAINLTPAPLHAEVNTQALEAGCHVYSEKPLAGTLEEAHALIELADSRGALLLCAPAVMATARFVWLRQALAEGAIGRPTLATAQIANMGPAAWREYTGDPRPFYGPGVGPLLDIGVYVLHAITGLLGPARRVQAFSGIAIPRRQALMDRLEGETIEVAADDQVVLHLELADGVLAQVLAAFTVPASKAPVLEIHGTEGTVSIAASGWYNANGLVDLFREGQWESVAPPPAATESLIMAGLPHFVECVQDGATPVLTATHARHVLEIVLAATLSSDEGRAVELATTF